MRAPITLTHDRDRPAAPPAVRLLAALTEHRSLMLGVTAGVIAYAIVVGSPPPTVQLVILAAAVTIVGLPHGALDHLVGRQLFAPTLGRRWWAVFGLLYLGLAGTMASIWIAFPLAALVVFLGLSALHFGWDDPLWVRRSSGFWDAVEHISVGALPIVLPTWLHAAEVTVIFGWMMPAVRPLDAEVVGAVAACAASVALPVAGLRFVRLLFDRPVAPAAAAELAAIVALHAVAPPLIAFLTYFCGWHSIRHALELANDLEPGRFRAGLRRFVREAAPMTLTTVAAALLAAGALILTDIAVDSVLASVIFIGLSVLTVPHMAMMALARAAVPASPPANRDEALRTRHAFSHPKNAGGDHTKASSVSGKKNAVGLIGGASLRIGDFQCTMAGEGAGPPTPPSIRARRRSRRRSLRS